ncbi:MAG: DUF3343 domain-containing protein [Proteobacteria bacterium]|jgi:hypothetical protein|nr:DUF3343 domain-containing protein [Pseudomonadota bacterium]
MILLFESVHRVIQAEASLTRAGVPCALLPTPKELSAECGMCVEVDAADLAAARAALGPLAVTVVGEDLP